MPWAPELFSAPAVAELEAEQRRDELLRVPYFAGILTGEMDALIESFAGEPEVHHPVRGRVRGKRAFETYVTDTTAWLVDRNASVEQVGHVFTETRSFEEVVIHLEDDTGPITLPIGIASEHRPHARLSELRVYYSSWPLTGRHANRPPVLQPDPGLRMPDVVAEYQQALAAGDLDAIVSAFEPDGYAREPAGDQYLHRGPQGLREFYASLFSNDGGIALEHCALVDDAHACVLEYNVRRWGKTELPPQAGVAVYVRGESGKLAAARIYDDTDPPIG